MKLLPHLICSALLTATLLYAVFHEQGLDQFFAILSGVDRNGLWLYVLLSIAGILLRALRYRSVLRTIAGTAETPADSKLIIVTAVRNALVDLLPARLGELGFLYVINSFGIRLLTATTAIGLCIVLDIAVLFALILTTIVFVPFTLMGSMIDGSSSSMLKIVLILVVSLVIMGSVLIYMNQILHKTVWLIALLEKKTAQTSLSRFHRFAELIQRALTEMEREFAELKKGGAYLRLISITVVLRLAKYLTLYQLLIAVVGQWGIGHKDLGFLITSVAFIAAETSASLPVSGLMGFGAYEGAWSAVFFLSGVNLPSTSSVIFAVHIITQVVGYTFGCLGLVGFFIIRMRQSKKQRRVETS